MYDKRSQFKYDLERTLYALKHDIKNVPTTSNQRIIQLLEYSKENNAQRKD
jgi:hypothetical protein